MLRPLSFQNYCKRQNKQQETKTKQNKTKKTVDYQCTERHGLITGENIMFACEHENKK